MPRAALARPTLEVGDRAVQRPGQEVEPRGADAVLSALILLQLLEGVARALMGRPGA
jgi:hypothetical protein